MIFLNPLSKYFEVMEPNERIPRIVVFGVGGAGCKTINQLSRENLDNVALVGIDTDKGQIGSMQAEIKKVLVGKSLDEDALRSFGNAEDSIRNDLKPIDEVLQGADVAIIVAGLGRKTGTYASSIIAEKITNQGIPCLALLIYPFVTNGGGASESGKALKRLKENVNAIIVIDNNMKRKYQKEPILDIFRLINSYIVTFIWLLNRSITGAGSMNLSVDELKYFFQGNYIYIMAVGHGLELKDSAKKALTELMQYIDQSAIRKLLVGVSSTFEVGIGEMKKMGDVLQERTPLEELRWIVSSDGEKKTRMILVAGVSELPLLKSTVVMEDMPLIEQEEGPYEIEEESLEKFETEHTTPPALVGMHLLETPEQTSLSELPQSDKTKKEPAPRHKKGQKGEYKGIKKVEATERGRKDNLDEALEDVAAELTGFPSYKLGHKKGQKRLSEYADEFGIGYI